MKKNKPVFWHQGMFIQPQHFQYSEAYQQSLLEPFQNYVQPHFWGVVNLELSQTALSHRSCELQTGELIFPDGTHVVIPDNAQIVDRTFTDDQVDPEKPLTVYIGLRKFKSNDSNATVVKDASRIAEVKTRYFTRIDPRTVEDMYQDGPEAQIQELEYKVEFLFDTEQDLLNEFHVIPVAQVVRVGDRLEYNSQYVPPLVNLDGNAYLYSLVREIRDEITGRALQLDYSGSTDNGAGAYDPNVLRYRFALQSLSQFIPRLYHVCECEKVHPWDVYGMLRELVGASSTFSHLVNMLGERQDGERMVLSYDHTDLGNCFTSIRSLITTLLNEISIGPQFMVEMRLEDHQYAADIPEDFFNQQVDYYVILNTMTDRQEWYDSFETTGKLASSDTAIVLAERSLPGVPMSQITNPPIGLPKKEGAHYFRLDPADEEWSKVRRQRNAALFWPEAPEDLHVELVILRK